MSALRRITFFLCQSLGFSRSGKRNPYGDACFRHVTESSGRRSYPVVKAIVGVEEAGDLCCRAQGESQIEGLEDAVRDRQNPAPVFFSLF